VKASAREKALRILYEADHRSDELEPGGGRAGRIVEGVRSEQAALDQVLESVSINWRVDRMPPIDRAILRIALYELRHSQGTSTGTIIDEAVELAKRYSTEQSGPFVNGVLDTLARLERPDEAKGILDGDG
jgi:N utilization substance protein B